MPEEPKTKVYISGAITGRKKEEYTAHFRMIEEALREAGYEPVNPVALPAHAHHDGSYCQQMREDIRALLDCHCVLLLDGWVTSRGALMEKTIATCIGLPICYEEDFKRSGYMSLFGITADLNIQEEI